MVYDIRWQVVFAPDLAMSTIRFDAGEIFLRHDTQRLVLLNTRGHTVDARYMHEGERIDVGCIISFPCHFAKIRDRLPVVGSSRGGAPASTGEAAAWIDHEVCSVVHGNKPEVYN